MKALLLFEHKVHHGSTLHVRKLKSKNVQMQEHGSPTPRSKEELDEPPGKLRPQPLNPTWSNPGTFKSAVATMGALRCSGSLGCSKSLVSYTSKEPKGRWLLNKASSRLLVGPTGVCFGIIGSLPPHNYSTHASYGQNSWYEAR